MGALVLDGMVTCVGAGSDYGRVIGHMVGEGMG